MKKILNFFGKNEQKAGNINWNRLDASIHRDSLSNFSRFFPDVEIYAFDQNPAGSDKGNEWVTFYNPSNESVDIGNWTLETAEGERETIAEGTILYPGAYYTYTSHYRWLDNQDESIILKDSEGKEVDRTPVLCDTKDDNRCWEHKDSEWVFEEFEKPTPKPSYTPTPTTLTPAPAPAPMPSPSPYTPTPIPTLSPTPTPSPSPVTPSPTPTPTPSPTLGIVGNFERTASMIAAIITIVVGIITLFGCARGKISNTLLPIPLILLAILIFLVFGFVFLTIEIIIEIITTILLGIIAISTAFIAIILYQLSTYLKRRKRRIRYYRVRK